MTKKNNVKQHYIPVCYLRGFSGNDKTLHVYDKQISKAYGKAFEQIGYADHLYRIDKKYINKDVADTVDENFYETEYFAKNIESEYNRILIDLRQRANEWLLYKNPTPAFSTDVDKDHFAAYVIQLDVASKNALNLIQGKGDDQGDIFKKKDEVAEFFKDKKHFNVS